MINSDKNLKELISEYVIKERDNHSELNSILILIKNKKEEYTNMIKELEPFITSQNDLFRKHSMKLISLVVERISSLILTETEFTSALKFAFSKLKDVVCAPASCRTIFCKRNL
jgi:hypothetical protein